MGKTEPMGSAILPPHSTTSHHCFRFAWLHHPISTPGHLPSSSRLLSPPLFCSPKFPFLSKAAAFCDRRGQARRCLNVWELQAPPATDGASDPLLGPKCYNLSSVLELPGLWALEETSLLVTSGILDGRKCWELVVIVKGGEQ